MEPLTYCQEQQLMFSSMTTNIFNTMNPVGIKLSTLAASVPYILHSASHDDVSVSALCALVKNPSALMVS